MQRRLSQNKMLSAVKMHHQELMEILQNIVVDLKNAPKGKLKIVKKRSSVQFYHRQSASDKNGTYLNKKKLLLTKGLAQKRYNLAVEKVLRKQIAVLDDFIENYSGSELAEIYENSVPQLKELITPIILPLKDFVDQWQTVEYQGLPFDDVENEYYTEKGERVRSKSEIIIANALNRAGVPYRYEFPVRIKEGTFNGTKYNAVFYPDFYCLNEKTGEEIIWEHFGLMDNPEYVKNAILKIVQYAENGFVCGKNLIYTMESVVCPLNSKFVKRVIEAYFS